MTNIDTFLRDFLQISSWQTVVALGCLVVLLIIVGVMTKKRVSFSVRVFIAMVLGLLLGLGLQAVAGFPDDPTQLTFIAEATAWFDLLGSGFMSLIRMLVIPLVMVSIIHVFVNLEEGVNVGKMVRSTVAITMGMVVVAAIVGLCVGMLFGVGAGSAAVGQTAEIKEVSSLANTLLNLIPANPVKAMVEVNIIALVIFSIFIAMGARRMHQRTPAVIQPFIDLINALHSIIISVTLTIIKLMPFAIVPLLANTIALRGLSSLTEVGVFVIALYVAVAAMFVIQLILLAVIGLNPITYIKKSINVLMLAFTSRSSLGTLPVTVETLSVTMGVQPSTANFVASFGTSAGTQGCAGVFPALLLVYVCNLTGVPMDFTMIIMSVIVVAIGSLGIAGVPGTATMAASVALSGTGLGSYYPLISPILAIDPLIDMGRTFLNVSGAMVNSLAVDRYLGQLNKDEYNDISLKLEAKADE